MNVVSAWTRQIENGQQPSSADLHDHLAAVHKTMQVSQRHRMELP